MARPAIHPGEHLAEELGELGLSATDLARRLGITTVRVELILSGLCPRNLPLHAVRNPVNSAVGHNHPDIVTRAFAKGSGVAIASA
jgi:hypothetical protein